MSEERLKRILEEHTDEIDQIAELSDADIDFSDIPEQNPEDWKHSIRGIFYKPVKRQLTLRIDADVVDWFKRTQPKYQTAMNDALREYMIAQRRKSG